MAKSLFCAGTTWPGVFTGEDQRALDVLCARSDVDPQRIGCAGLSGGGLRTVYLAGLDDRIRCACCAGMMTTWRDYLLNKCYTHTWMIYIPGLPPDLDYPEILGLHAPRPTLVLNNTDDQLFTMGEMRRADRILRGGLHQGRCRRSLSMRFLPRPAQVRPGHAGRGLRLVRALAEIVIRPGVGTGPGVDAVPQDRHGTPRRKSTSTMIVPMIATTKPGIRRSLR